MAISGSNPITVSNCVQLDGALVVNMTGLDILNGSDLTVLNYIFYDYFFCDLHAILDHEFRMQFGSL